MISERQAVVQTVAKSVASGDFATAAKRYQIFRELEVTVSVRDDILPNSVPVSFSSREHREHEKLDRLERNLGLRILPLHQSASAYGQCDYMRMTSRPRKWFDDSADLQESSLPSLSYL